jgi:hypothetical protein
LRVARGAFFKNWRYFFKPPFSILKSSGIRYALMPGYKSFQP